MDQTSTSSSANRSTCPECGNEHLYRLADGRFKCRSCKKKFTPGNRRSRLTAEAMEAILTAFTDSTPASTVATATGLNLKTVHYYFRRIRDLLAEDRQKYLAHAYGNAEIPSGFFAHSGHQEKWRDVTFIGCLLVHDDEIELLFVADGDDRSFTGLDPETVSGWLVAADRRALENLQLDRIYCLAGNCSSERARKFWLNAKRQLSTYGGGLKKHFRLYLREMEFRNNIKNVQAAREHIGNLVEQEFNPTTGEKNE